MWDILGGSYEMKYGFRFWWIWVVKTRGIFVNNHYPSMWEPYSGEYIYDEIYSDCTCEGYLWDSQESYIDERKASVPESGSSEKLFRKVLFWNFLGILTLVWFLDLKFFFYAILVIYVFFGNEFVYEHHMLQSFIFVDKFIPETAYFYEDEMGLWMDPELVKGWEVMDPKSQERLKKGLIEEKRQFAKALELRHFLLNKNANWVNKKLVEGPVHNWFFERELKNKKK